jgi:23S rRNA (pseudouridine1915-N3)-methyltransferase
MKIRIVAVGKLKEGYWREAVSEYVKRLSPFADTEIVEVAEGRTVDEEQRNILSKIKGFTVLLAIDGEAMTSGQLAAFINTKQVSGVSEITFVIGGSHGVSRKVYDSADYCLSFSAFTFPHQMMRVILLGQVYRAFMINGNREYHK